MYLNEYASAVFFCFDYISYFSWCIHQHQSSAIDIKSYLRDVTSYSVHRPPSCPSRNIIHSFPLFSSTLAFALPFYSFCSSFCHYIIYHTRPFVQILCICLCVCICFCVLLLLPFTIYTEKLTFHFIWKCAYVRRQIMYMCVNH